MFRPILRRRTTCKTCSDRTTSTEPLRKLSLALLVALALATPAALAARDVEPAPPVTAILAAYDRATHEAELRSLETSGTLVGEGLTGDFHSWRSGANERDDDRMGPRKQTTLRLGEHIFLRNASGNVRELKGYLRRRALTAEFVDSGAFVKSPERSSFLGFGTLDGKRMWRLQVTAPGGEPETLWIDVATGFALRLEYIDGDGPTTVDFSDWRNVEGHSIPYKTVTSDGDRAFDVVEVTTSVSIDAPVSPDVFAPLSNNTIVADAVQTVPLLERGAHEACRVAIGGTSYEFLLDTGSQSVLLDSRLAKAAGLREEGALEVRGATRSGGLHLVTLPRLDIGAAHLENLVATSLDLGGSTSGAVRLDGILGFPFFASAEVELDFAHHTMRFGPPGSFTPKGEKIALDLDRGLIEATFRVNDRVSAPFIVDTGNSGELLMYRPFISTHPGLVPFTLTNALNYGIGGSTRTYRSSVDTLTLGDENVYHRVADVVMAEKGAFADRIDAGNVGLGILRNFVVTFDLANSAMYLEKGAAFDDGRRRMVTRSS